MKKLLLSLLFITALTAGLVDKLPLAFLMKQSGAAGHGLSWQQARGTIWNGQLTGVSFAGASFGAVQVQTRPRDLVTKGIASRLAWRAPSGGATAHLMFARDPIVVSNLEASIALSELPTLHPELRRAGASLTLTNAALQVTSNGECVQIDGEAELDLIQRLGQSYNRAWPLLRGTPECVNGGFSLPLLGTSAAGEAFEINLLWSRGGQPEADVKIAGLDPQATLALQSLGFIKTGNQLTLRQGAVLAQEN